MDLIKAKSILARLQAMINTLESNPQLSALERDLILNYLRDLYDVFLESSAPALPVLKIKDPVVPIAQDRESSQKILEFKFEHHDEKAPAEEPVPVAQIPVPEPVVIASVPPKEEIKTPVESTPGVSKSNPIPVSILELFDIRKGSELSDKLNDLPLRDINRAIGINDRMEIIHTLFGGQKQLFEQIITDLNNFKVYEEALNLLGHGPAIHYKWDHDDRKEKAVEFIRMIRRRYL